ncbi:MAG: hypothetical protein ACJAYB_001841 [Psychromonas sp.]|jgi:hypothetical protein
MQSKIINYCQRIIQLKSDLFDRSRGFKKGTIIDIKVIKHWLEPPKYIQIFTTSKIKSTHHHSYPLSRGYFSRPLASAQRAR